MGWNKEKKQREEISSNVPITQVLLLVKSPTVFFQTHWVGYPCFETYHVCSTTYYCLKILLWVYLFGMSKGIFFIFVVTYFRNI